ncbi:PLP-dependent aminotransferase family protein [Rhodoblastus sp.]|uniref:aminotransferase-like domain-containing protein n=1 Tax=Rhodoblastus sp. TaxID=1962975 RepID=UPI0035B23221
MKDWAPNLATSGKPLYLAIADALDEDIRLGRLAIGDRLPPQRRLAERLAIDFTTVARGYAEARKRGLVSSTVGMGTFICARHPAEPAPRADDRPGRPDIFDPSMNLPPEPTDPELIERMRAGLAAVGQDLVSLLRYQRFGGDQIDKDAASAWLGRRALVPTQDRLFITPGAHAAMMGIFSVLATRGDTILCEAITYPGARAISAQLGLNLLGLPMDEHGVDPAALDEACRLRKPKALYLNPTLHNPTTLTVPEARRAELVAVCRRHNLPIVEDDAYGFLLQKGPHPFAALAPDLTWHIAGLAKCIGAGLRAAFVVTPSAKAAWPFAAAMRAANVMASPLTVALATRWIEDGTADSILRNIRAETRARQALAAEILPPGAFKADPLSFCLWLTLSEGWTRSAFAEHMRQTGLGVVSSDAFTASGVPPEAARVCLGGPISREKLANALGFMAHALNEAPSLATSFV